MDEPTPWEEYERSQQRHAWRGLKFPWVEVVLAVAMGVFLGLWLFNRLFPLMGP